MMDSTTSTTIVLVLLWLYLCCLSLGFLVALIRDYSTTDVLPITTTLATVLLGVCMWQCKKAGYLVSPMTWYHWVLLVLLVLLQVVAVVVEQVGWGVWRVIFAESTYPIYGIVVLLLGILGGTLYCGWKCNLFCRPCCKSQYVCYGSAIVVVLVLLVVLAVTASLIRFQKDGLYSYDYEGVTEIWVIGYLGKVVVPCVQCYSMAMIWNTIVKLPYTVPEVVSLIASAITVASILAVAVPPDGTEEDDGEEDSVLSNTIGYSLLALHLLSLGIAWYCLEYKATFYWPKQYMCFGVLLMVMLGALVAVVTLLQIPKGRRSSKDVEAIKYTLIGYSLLLTVPTLWYAYRCGLLTWCHPKKKGLTATDTAKNTTIDTDIAKES